MHGADEALTERNKGLPVVIMVSSGSRGKKTKAKAKAKQYWCTRSPSGCQSQLRRGDRHTCQPMDVGSRNHARCNVTQTIRELQKLGSPRRKSDVATYTKKLYDILKQSRFRASRPFAGAPKAKVAKGRLSSSAKSKLTVKNRAHFSDDSLHTHTDLIRQDRDDTDTGEEEELASSVYSSDSGSDNEGEEDFYVPAKKPATKNRIKSPPKPHSPTKMKGTGVFRPHPPPHSLANDTNDKNEVEAYLPSSYLGFDA